MSFCALVMLLIPKERTKKVSGGGMMRNKRRRRQNGGGRREQHRPSFQIDSISRTASPSSGAGSDVSSAPETNSASASGGV